MLRKDFLPKATDRNKFRIKICIYLEEELKLSKWNNISVKYKDWSQAAIYPLKESWAKAFEFRGCRSQALINVDELIGTRALQVILSYIGMPFTSSLFALLKNFVFCTFYFGFAQPFPDGGTHCFSCFLYSFFAISVKVNESEHLGPYMLEEE